MLTQQTHLLEKSWTDQFEAHLFKLVEIIGLFLKVEHEQFCLQILQEILTTDEVFDDAVRERIAVQFQITCNIFKDSGFLNCLLKMSLIFNIEISHTRRTSFV